MKMGGCSCIIETNNLVEAIEKLRKTLNEQEQMGMYLNSISICEKNKKGKYDGIGNNGIEVEIGQRYNKPPKKKVVIYYHIHS